jgi:hypothetical protein
MSATVLFDAFFFRNPGLICVGIIHTTDHFAPGTRERHLTERLSDIFMKDDALYAISDANLAYEIRSLSSCLDEKAALKVAGPLAEALAIAFIHKESTI